MSFPFGSRTIAALVRAIDQGYTKAETTTLLFEAGVDLFDPEAAPNKATRIQLVFKALRVDGTPESERGALELARLVAAHGAPADPYPGAVWFQGVHEALASDGWEYDIVGNRLSPTVPGTSLVAETSLLEQQLTEHGWTTSAGHYRQALDAFGSGAWASANAQLRSLLEDLLPSVAEHLDGSRPKEVQAALDRLRARGVLVDGEFSFAKGLWTLCQPRGSHPGLSDPEECRFRIVSVTSYCRFLLARLPA